jgi:hypothetical protein
MTTAITDYPRKQLGKVAEVNGMTSDDGPWIVGRMAFAMTGVKPAVLARWEEEGVISVLQPTQGAPRLFLKPEMELVAKLGRVSGPPNLRTLRRYLESHPGGGEGGNGPKKKQGTTTGPQRDDTPKPDDSEPDDSEGVRLTAALAAMLEGQRFVVEIVNERRVRVMREEGSRGVEIECRRRPEDGDRWWFTWGGGVWMCEADKPADAGLHVRGATRKVGAAR